ncbi:hypothetical protein GGR50DRAFT_691624 [Xylaria sp. CBS 124048]|nr:hypothetical protein GGR50DRAFT_691624 [Xylaria sp. CBS 124048]
MTRPQPVDPARAIVENAVPGVRVDAISIIPTSRLLKSFRVILADGRTLLLTLSLPSSRLLRSEQWLMQSEAALVEWLVGDFAQAREEGTRYIDDKRLGRCPQGESSPRRWAPHSASDSWSSRCDRLITYLPTLVKHSSCSAESGLTFSLFHPTSGDILSGIHEPLSQAEQASIHFQKGRLMQCIASIQSPNGRFGIPITVLGCPESPGRNAQKTARGHELDLDGADSWKKTFHLLLEGVLRDGEDLAVAISYERIRTTFHKFSHLLDAVKTPRLVVYDADEDDNVLVSRVGKTPLEQERPEDKAREGPKMRSYPANTLNVSREEMDGNETTTIQITGLRDWSKSIFGDPLFATVFSHATPAFERGFRERRGNDIITNENNSIQKKEDKNNEAQKTSTLTDIIEDPINAPTRILLYECYHATVSIVCQFCRPDTDSSRREIVARRRLTAALAKLENVAVSAIGGGRQTSGKRARCPSREGPVKRPRGDTPSVRER